MVKNEMKSENRLVLDKDSSFSEKAYHPRNKSLVLRAVTLSKRPTAPLSERYRKGIRTEGQHKSERLKTYRNANQTGTYCSAGESAAH